MEISQILIATVEELCSYNLTPYQFQRTINEEVVRKYYDAQINLYNKFKIFDFPGVITLLPDKDGYFILDGQHRIQVIMRLYENPLYKEEIAPLEIVISFRHDLVNQPILCQEIYRILNESNMINESIGKQLTSLEKNKVLKEIFLREYPESFKKETRPFTKVETLIKEINDNSNINFLSTDQILFKIKEYNVRFYKTGYKDIKYEWKIICDKHNFYALAESPKCRWVKNIL